MKLCKKCNVKMFDRVVVCGMCGSTDLTKVQKKGITEGGKCKCGTPLPDVKDTETPYQYCSEECKTNDEIKEKINKSKETRIITCKKCGILSEVKRGNYCKSCHDDYYKRHYRV